MNDVIDLRIDVEATFDTLRALNMTEAAKLIRGRRGPLNTQVCVRFANAKRGYRPLGPGGPLLILPSIKLNNQVLTMPEWVEAFNAARLRYAVRAQQPLLARPNRTREASHGRAARSLESMGFGVAGSKLAAEEAAS